MMPGVPFNRLTGRDYKSLFIQARGVLKKQLRAPLRRSRTLRRGRGYAHNGPGRGQIANAVSIRSARRTRELRSRPGMVRPKLVHKVVFSMPAGTPPEGLLRPPEFCPADLRCRA